MAFFEKIFSIKKENIRYVIRIFGIKFKIISLKSTITRFKAIKWLTRTDFMDFRQAFLWSYENKLTYKQKKWFLETYMYENLGYFPNLKTPKSFNEKLNWMKLHYDNPLAKRCVDKYEFKNYIKEKLGDGYTIPLIGVYENVNDIDFDSLPNKFVAKSTLEGGGIGVIIVRDKSRENIEDLKFKLNHYLKSWQTSYYSILAKGYEGLKPRIIIEEYMEQIAGQLYDYKLYCFHGEPKLVYVATDHFPGVVSKISFYDLDWKKLNIAYGSHSNKQEIPKPKNFDEMVRISKILSKDFPYVRVDFYEVGNRIYVGELTFTPGGGFGQYNPREWDYKIGEYLDLDKLEEQYLIKDNK